MQKSKIATYHDRETLISYTFDRYKLLNYINKHGWPTEFGFKLAFSLGMFDFDLEEPYAKDSD